MEYYVSPSGDDSNPGTMSLPWRTIQKAADTLIAGDTVYVRGGVYNEQVIIECCGTPSGYITFAAYPGEQPVVDGTNIDMIWGEGLINVGTPAWSDTPLPPRGFYGVEYIIVDGFKVQNSREWGIRTCFSNNIIIRNNQVFNTRGAGISTDNGYENPPYGTWDPTHCSYIYCYGNYVGTGVNYGGTQEAISFSKVDHFEIMHNRVIDTSKEGIDCKCEANYGIIAYNEVVTPACGIYYDAFMWYQHDVSIHSNWVHGDGGIYIGTEVGGAVENVYIYNNLICNTSNGFGMLGSAGDRINVNVVNNTYNVGNIVFQLVATSAGMPVGLTIRNNIIVGNRGINFGGGITEEDIILDHNLFNCDTGAYGTDYVIGDPLWINPSVGDYHLQAGSPAIGMGSNVGAPSVDYDGVQRGAEIDIGAFESGGQICSSYTTQSNCEAAGCYWCNGVCQAEPCGMVCSDYTTQASCENAGCYWYNNGCHSTPQVCSFYTTQSNCEAAGCYWWNGSCHDAPAACSQLDNQLDCESHGCYWWNGFCHGNAPSCSDLNNQSDCIRHGCYWYNNSCHSTPQVCSSYTTQSNCEAAGCYWCNGVCQAEPCGMVCSDYTTQASCENAGCYWYNNGCHTATANCAELNNKIDCEKYGCYWCNGVCQTQPCPGTNWLLIASIALVATVGVAAGVLLGKRRH